jgi:hypothetical protein
MSTSSAEYLRGSFFEPQFSHFRITIPPPNGAVPHGFSFAEHFRQIVKMPLTTQPSFRAALIAFRRDET